MIRSAVNRLRRFLAPRSGLRFFIRNWLVPGDVARAAQVFATMRAGSVIAPSICQGPEASRIAVVAPHPDDEVIGPGGTLLRAAADGATITCIYVTDGDEQAENAAARQGEARDAAKQCGFQPIFLGEASSAIACDEGAAKRLAEAIRRAEPEALFVPFLLDDNDDHRRVNQLLYAALRRGLIPANVEVWAYSVYAPLPGNVVVDITDMAQRKAAAIRRYATQTAKRDWAHFALGVNAASSRLLPKTPDARYAESFFVMPLGDYAELCCFLRTRRRAMLSVETVPPLVTGAAVTVSRAGAEDAAAWDAYLGSKPRIAPFAAFGWGGVLRECYGAEPVLFAAREAGGHVRGVLFGYERGTPDRSFYSPPFGLVADDDAATRALLGAAHDYATGQGLARAIVSSGDQGADTPYRSWTKTTVVKRLADNEKAAWEALRGKTRHRIRHSAQYGIEVRQGFEHLPGFYAAYRSRMTDKCVPYHSLAFLEKAASLLRDRSVLYVAIRDGRVLGGVMFFLGRDVAVSQYNAVFSEAMPLGVNSVLTWEAMRDLIRRGITHLDLGESRPGSGVYQFKTIQFGGEPRDIFYYDVMRAAGSP
jgi:LmbE family N-acetylglucosaminyl deacetylase